MNYLTSFLVCIAGSIAAWLSNYPDYHWLFVSDFNVAVFLFLAFVLEKDKK